MRMKITEAEGISRPTELRQTLLGIVTMLAVGGVAIFGTLYHELPLYSPDSASYIDQARSILGGGGFLSRPWNLSPSMGDLSPDNLFPPGLPITMAVGAALSGIPAEIIGGWVGVISLLLIPALTFLAFRRVTGPVAACCVGTLAAFSPNVVQDVPYVSSDTYSLALVIASTGLTVAAFSQPARSIVALAGAGGLIAAAAYLTRNAHLAFLLATWATFGAQMVLGPAQERKRDWPVILAWSVGVALVLVPWLIRNLLVFGSLQPYSMDPSTVGWWLNTRIYVSAMIGELLGSATVGSQLGWNTLFLALLLIAGAFVLRSLVNISSRLGRDARFAMLLSLTYVALGSAVVIAARSKYEWGEMISGRHATQYVLFAMLPIAMLVRNADMKSRYKLLVGAFAVTTLLCFRIASLPALQGQDSGYIAWTAETRAHVELIEAGRSSDISPCSADPDQIVVSNYAFLYRILCNANARHLGMHGFAGKSISEALSLPEMVEAREKRSVVVAFHAGRGIKPGTLPVEDASFKDIQSAGWSILANTRDSFIAEYAGSPH